jgi:hypothetical protein
MGPSLSLWERCLFDLSQREREGPDRKAVGRVRGSSLAILQRL